MMYENVTILFNDYVLVYKIYNKDYEEDKYWWALQEMSTFRTAIVRGWIHLNLESAIFTHY